MGIMTPQIEGTKAEQLIAKTISKPWHKKVESWLVIANILVLLTNIFFTYWSSAGPSKIRTQCLAEGEMSPVAIGIADDSARFKFIDEYYQNCLHRFGLEK